MIFLGLVLLLLAIIAIKLYSVGGKCRITKDLKGYVVFITGANTGIGKETAIQLSRLGATVVIACRDTKKAEGVITQLKNAYLLKLDLSDLFQIRECVEEFKKLNLDKIDILINNAGVMATNTYITSKQNLELQFATNHIGHFYLTELLMPYIKKSSQPRVINVSSLAHTWGKLDFQDLNCTKWANSLLWGKKYSFSAYGNSKLCNVLHALELSQKYNIKAFSLHPGVVRTELVRHTVSNPILKAIYTVFQPIYYIFSKSPLEGAQTTLYCALEDESKLKNGGYYSDCKFKQPARCVDRQLAIKLWEKSEEIIQQFIK